MSYDSQIAALSPWGYWKTTETSGNLADSSGNSRTMTVTGSPTYAQTGPDGSTADAISWTNAASQHAETSATTNAGVFTYVVWVYLTATPAASVALMSRAIAYGTAGAADGRLYIDTAGKLNFSIFTGTTTTITASTALPTNTWVMVTASVGAAGMRLRQNKTSMATNAANSAYTGANQLIFVRGGDSLMTGTAPVKISKPSYFTSQLSNTDTDALYDTGIVPPTITISGEVAQVSATARDGLALTAIKVAGEVAQVVTTARDGAPVEPIAIAGETATSAVVARDGTALTAIRVVGETATLSVSALDGELPGVPISGETAAVGVTAWDGGVVLPVGTDTSNALDGLSLVAAASVEVLVPVDLPATTTLVDKAIPLPTPTMVNGRPT